MFLFNRVCFSFPVIVKNIFKKYLSTSQRTVSSMHCRILEFDNVELIWPSVDHFNLYILAQNIHVYGEIIL